MTPTNTEAAENTVHMPTGHGDNALHVLYIPRLTPCISPSPTSGDGRPGREYGHGKLLTLDIDSEGRLHATTNDRNVVESWPEINKLVRQLANDTVALQLAQDILRDTVAKAEQGRKSPGTDLARQ